MKSLYDYEEHIYDILEEAKEKLSEEEYEMLKDRIDIMLSS